MVQTKGANLTLFPQIMTTYFTTKLLLVKKLVLQLILTKHMKIVYFMVKVLMLYF